jgi:hypothetical protein
MCLSIAVYRPGDVLGQGEHAGFEWMVVHNTMGYRCGYVRVPKGHPWHGKDDDSETFADVHGGITFAAPDEPCGKGDDDAWWVGFDCAHAGDAPDPSLPGRTPRMRSLISGVVRSQAYVEAECRRLCEQATEARRDYERGRGCR